MDDLITRFRELDAFDAPDLRAEARRRLPTSAPPADPSPRRGPTERLVVVLVAFLVFGAAAALGLRALRDETLVRPQPAETPWSWVADGWTELPPPPQWRDRSAIVWTGSELLSWGGRVGGGGPAVNDGFAFDPATRTWTAIPPAPGPLGAPAAVWTGDEALFFELGGEPGSGSMFAFDPDARRWRSLSPPPQEPAWGGAWAWTGSELVVAGGGDVGDPTTHRAWALDPVHDTWRPLPEMPIAVNLADATWTGEGVVVLGSEIDRRNHASTRTAVAAAYDPVEDSWRRLPDPPVSAQTSAVDTVGGRLVAWEGYSPASAEYLPTENRWRSIDMGGLEGSECYAQGAVVDASLVTWGCGRPAVWTPDASAWVNVESPVLPDRSGITYSAGWTFAAGEVAIIAQVESITSGRDIRVGDPEAPRHLWAWRPPADLVPEPPTALRAENLVGGFLADQSPGWEAFLPGSATQDVLVIVKEGRDGVPSLEGGSFQNWNLGQASAVDDGTFEVPVDLVRDGDVVASLIFTVGPGTAADGREGQLVIVGVRAIDRSAESS